jgi:methylated-DNA-protein-cysteine methyltransferase related protein
MDYFFDNVRQVVKLIPEGRVSTYGAIARFLGASKSSRMVGWVLNKSVNVAEIPAHRVVNRYGNLTGKKHFQTLSFMEEMLNKEGVLVQNDLVLDFEDLFWDPSIELKW